MFTGSGSIDFVAPDVVIKLMTIDRDTKLYFFPIVDDDTPYPSEMVLANGEGGEDIICITVEAATLSLIGYGKIEHDAMETFSLGTDAKLIIDGYIRLDHQFVDETPLAAALGNIDITTGVTPSFTHLLLTDGYEITETTFVWVFDGGYVWTLGENEIWAWEFIPFE
jgi:hypothetical protein